MSLKFDTKHHYIHTLTPHLQQQFLWTRHPLRPLVPRQNTDSITMSRSRLMAVAVAGSALIGGAFYATRRPEKQSPEELRRNKADRARDLGLGSAGMGLNQVTGGPEAGAAPSRPDETDRMRPVHTTASSKDKLPSGGVGGGEGAGRTSARATELPTGKGSQESHSS
ncbi:hypothetical protein E4U61_001717 [Claviceps capensis]|nr:hypothetical protein E4U61_001717 [Claviceps capensis]